VEIAQRTSSAAGTAVRRALSKIEVVSTQMNFRFIKTLTVVTLATVVATAAHAQQAFDSAKDDYDSHCSGCHGPGGTGGGPYAASLNITVPNLATLSQKNGGMFPYSRVYETIAGTLPARGKRDMPMWGQEFSHKTSPRNPTPDTFVRTRINALVLYIHRLQAK
jgi:mono/diheme cytochrome c family protein